MVTDCLPLLIDVRQVSQMLSCSPRHVYRLSERGAMPKAIKLGGLNRWDRGELERWVRDQTPGTPSKSRPRAVQRRRTP